MSRAVLAAAAAVLALHGAGCQRPPPPAKAPPAAALSAVAGSPAAQAKLRPVGGPPKAAPAPARSAPRPGPQPAFRVTATGALPWPRERAEAAGLAAAQDAVERGLAGLDPPVAYRPTENEVVNEFVRGSRTVPATPDQRGQVESIDPDYKAKPLVYVEYDVEVTADQVRQLRAGYRVADGLRLLGVLTAVFGAGFLFLRLDERTKGYLTRWLAAGAVALALGAAAAMYLV